jgi:hypothetical protein
MLSYVAFWIGTSSDPRPASAGNGGTLAFHASSWQSADDFQAAPLANGGICDEGREVRPHHGRDHNREVVGEGT